MNATITNTKRVGNGHMPSKKRNLTAAEKAFLREQFIALDGRLVDNENTRLTSVVEWRNAINAKAKVPVTTLQVAGNIVPLHMAVKRGDIVLRDRRAYDAHMEKHHARYPKRHPGLAEKYGHKMLVFKHTPTSFWNFFRRHRATFNRVLGAVCWKYAQHMDRREIQNEILIRLERNWFERKWNPGKAALSTYLSNTASGYAQHILELAQFRPTWESVNIAEENRRTRIPLDVCDDDGHSFQLADESDLAAELEQEDTVRFVRSRIPDTLKPTFDRMYEGRKNTEIAAELKISQNSVTIHEEKVREAARHAHGSIFRRSWKGCRDESLPEAYKQEKEETRNVQARL